MPVIIMTGHADVALAVEAMKAGAIDFIEKPFDDDVLLRAIENGLQALQAGQRARGQISGIRQRYDSLSERERQVLEGLVKGHTNKTIAFDLRLSPRTIEIHRARIMTKMGAGSLSELVRMILALDPQF